MPIKFLMILKKKHFTYIAISFINFALLLIIFQLEDIEFGID